MRCISEHRVVYDVNIPVWAIPHLCKRVIPSSTCLKIRFATGTEMNPSCRVSKVFSRLQLNSSVTRQRCSLSSSKPGWTNWVKRLAQWSFGVTDDSDKRWRTSSSRSFCSRFKPVAYPVRILTATCTLSLEDSVNNPAAPTWKKKILHAVSSKPDTWRCTKSQFGLKLEATIWAKCESWATLKVTKAFRCW